MITKREEKKRLLRLSGLRGFLAMTGVMLIFMLFFIAIAPPMAHADIPRYINYQGKLTDANDDPVTGDVSITIRIYSAETGGTALWTETQTVTVTRGIFSILLGNSTALTSLDFNSAYWYSVEVASDGEMTPRQRLTSVGYAINADKLDGYDASQFLRADADTSLTGALTVSGTITGSANGDITLDPTGTGNIVMKIDSTSGDFKVTDGTTNWVKVSNAGAVTIAKDLTVSGTIYGNLASTGGDSTFSSIVVTGTSDLRGNISNSSGAVTVADALTQTGSTNQITLAGNVDANNGLDVTGALTVSGATTLSSALDMNSNVDLDYSGTSAALDVTQASTGPAAQFAGGRVIVGANELTNANALSTGELYVLGDLEVDGTLYGNVSSSGTTSLGATTLSSLIVTGTSDLQGNISNSTGTVTVADYLSVTQTDSSTSGTVVNTTIQPTYRDEGINSTTAATALKIAPTINYTGVTKTGSYTALKIAATETSLPTSTNYLIDAYAGADGTTQKFYVDNSGNAKIFGTLNMNSQKITGLAEPTASTDAATKNYADAIVPASAGGWTDGGTGVYLLTASDNVGIGTTSTGTYKLNVSGSTNTTSFYIGGTQVTADASELNKVDGYTGTAANLNTLTGASNADSLHTHTATGISSGVVFTAPSTAQTIQPTADVVPLTIKGKVSAASNVLSIYDAAAVPSEKIYVDSAGHMRVAETTTGDAQNSAATMYFGRNATDNWEVMGYDPTLGTKGKFTFSAPLQVEASSPTGITFIEKGSDGVISKSQDFTYDPSADQFSFSGGVFAQQFKNLLKNSSFEAFSAFETFHDLDPRYATGNFDPTMGGTRNTTSGYEGGWNNFEPDEWTWIGGDVFQNAPMSFTSNYNVAATSYTQDYTQGVSAVRIKDVMSGSGAENIGTGKDGELKQTISGLEPGKVYSVGIDMRVDPDTATATKGIVDIVNELNVTGLTLNGNITPSTTTINITQEIAGSVARLPSNGFLWIEPNTADAEQVSYTGKSADSVSGVTRGINGTTARNHSSGVLISCAFRPLEATVPSASTFKTFKGQFITDEMATAVEIHLIAQSTDPLQTAGTVLFDSAQVVAGKSVPEYQTGTITDSGDQTIYGALRIGRASDEKGGILSVDKFVRTRGVEFFTDDPGFTGQRGGFAGFGGINPPVGPYNANGTIGSLSLFTSGNYTGTTQTMSFYVQITSAGSPNQFKWYYDDGTGSGYVAGNNDVAINVSTSDVTLGTTGVKVRFGTTTGGASGDRWDFFATRMDPIGGYNSYGTTTTYTPSATRIFKDPDPWSPTYKQLIFEDGTNRVSISSLISLAGTPSQIDPAWAEWNGTTANSGGLSVNTSGNYTGAQEKFYKAQVVATGTIGSSSGTFKWSDGTYLNGNLIWSNPISMSFGEQPIGNEGVRVKFLENPMAGDPPNRLSDAYITGGVEGDTWGFGVHPGAGAGITAHTHSSSADGGILNAGSNKAASFTIDSENTALNRSINFGSGMGSSSIAWDSTLDKFTINNDVDISGTLTATNLAGATSTSGTTNTYFAVDTDVDGAITEPIQGAGFIIKGGTGDVNLTYDAANNLLNITGQSGPTDTFTGINIPAGTMYKIGGANLSAADVGAAVSGHGHAGADITSGTVSADRLPTAGANTAGIIPSTGLTNAMVSTNVNDAISWAKINKTGAVASDVGAIAVESDPLALKTLDADNIKDTHIDWGTGANQVSTTDMTEGANLYYTDARVDSRLDTDQTIGGAWTFSNNVTVPQAPVQATDAASKAYVDAGITGLSWKEAVLDIIENNTLVPPTENSGDRYLLSKTGGDPHANWDGAAAGDMVQFNGTTWVKRTPIDGDAVFVEDVDTGYVYTGSAWTPFTGTSAYTWGDGLSATGTTIDVGAGDGINVDANNVIATLGTAIDTTEITDGTIANLDISDTAGIATSKLSGAVTSINNHGLGNLATLSAVSGGAVGTITDDSIINDDIKSDAAIATSKLSGAVTSINNHGLGSLAALSAVSGGVGGTITDDSIVNDDIKSDAGILTSKLSGAVTSITGHGLGDLATLNSVVSATITDGSITSSDISSTAGILDSQLATSPTTRFYENFAEYVEAGLQPAASVNLTSNISAGTAYGRGARINKASATSKTYTANKDTYVDIDSSGNFQYTEVANDAGIPAVAGNSIRLAKVVTDGDNITTVTDLRSLYPVTANEIAPGAVTSTGIQDGSIGTAKLADSAVTSIKIANGTIVNEDIAVDTLIDQSKLNLSITNGEVANGAAIAWSKISKVGSVPSDVGAAANSHTHGATDLSGVIFTAPAAAQAIQPTADVVPLTIKGQASANSNVLSIYDAAATPTEKILVDKLGHMYIAENTAVVGSAPYPNSSATLYFGRNSTDNWETISYDPTLGETNPTKGKFTFSAPLQVEASSPTGITFVQKENGVITKSQGLTYNPDLDEFSFTGGKLKQTFQNLIRNGSFESYRPGGWENHNTTWGTDMDIITDSSTAKFDSRYLRVQDNSASLAKGMRYRIPMPDRVKGENITISVWARSATGTSTASIGYSYAASSTNAVKAKNISLTTTWKNFTWTFPDVVSNIATLEFYIYLYGAGVNNPDADGIGTIAGAATNSDYVYFDGITLVQGKLSLDYGPTPVLDTGNQVIYGNLAIGANTDPTVGSGMPTLIFGEPEASFYYAGYAGWSMESGQIMYENMGGGSNSGRFMFNKAIRIYPGHSTGAGAGFYLGEGGSADFATYRTDTYIQGRLEVDGQSGSAGPGLIVGGGTVGGPASSSPTNAIASQDAYVLGKLEADGGFYGDGSNISNINTAVQLNPAGAIVNSSGLKVNLPATTPGLVISNNALDVKLAPNQGLIKTTDGVQVDYDNSTIGIVANKLAITSGYASGSAYDSRFVNADGDTMTGPLTVNQTSTGNTLVLQSDGTPVVAFAKTGYVSFGSGAGIMAAPATNLNIKLGDAAGTNKLSVQTSAGAEKFAVLSDGTVKIDGGYTGVLGGGITLQPNGDIYFDGNMYQKGDTYTVDTVRFTGNYNVGVTSRFGVGANGNDANYLQIDQEGVITKAGPGSGGAVTVDDLFTQTGSDNQVTFQGNVDALNGLDVTGNITTTGTVDGIDISSDSWVTSGKIADGAVATADIANSAVTAAKIAIGAVEKSKILELRPYATTPAADNKVNVAAGIISVASNSRLEFAGAISPAFDPITANSRIDLLAIDSVGTLVVIPGVQAVSPTAPTYPTNKLVVAEVTITETAVQGVVIQDADIKDVRPFLNLGSASGDSSITTTDSVIFTIGRDTDETTNNVTLAFGNSSGGQKSIIYQGVSSDDFVFNDDISLGANSLKFASNTLTDAKVGNYDSHLLNTSNPHSVTAAQIGGTGIVSEINAAGTSGVINTNRLASEILTQTEGDTRYLTPVKALLTAEYSNAIMYGDGSFNSGTMAVKNTADLNWRNYYEWSSQNTVLQDYTISVRYELPQDFSGWALANAIKLGYVTQTALNADNKVDVTIYKAGSATAIASSAANYSASWSEIVIDDSALGAWSARDVLIIEIKAYSKNGNFTRVGDITLNYTR